MALMISEEPPKVELQKFLEIEHNGALNASTPYPKRVSRVSSYDVIGSNKIPQYHESLVDVEEGVEISREIVSTAHHASLTLGEFDELVKAVWASSLFKEAIAELHMPTGFEVVVEPWPYGGNIEDDNPRFFQGLCFAQDTRNKNPDSNFYAYPLPLIPIMDATTREIVRIDKLATGGIDDGFEVGTHDRDILAHCKPAEYVPELLEQGTRKDMKPINVVQPEGASFVVGDDESLVEWQKWRFRTVPYADARSPFYRKQAFDFGDGGAGNCANNLELGCDCLGVIKYFNGTKTESNGTVTTSPNVICLHEQDAGIGWKHTNWRTGRAVVTRHRELVVSIHHYPRKLRHKTTNTSFCVRIDPAIDGPSNSVVVEESHAVADKTRNPYGNFYEVVQKQVEKASWLDAAPQNNLVVKMVNPGKRK
ncbi:hypothetical protein EYC84_004064 [Monilinia fructicola]|uniref:Amine oxidase n=1 Tax=Monilinia fructicola TaxID=38448 RepID=A0A5M9K1W2_MONFR|nr:hypothetical protein EYC84_004064 [Monilinia fructicola]